jgi:hypothetical protein
MGWVDLDWMCMTQFRERLRAVVNAIMNLHVPKKNTGTLLTSWVTVSFSRKTLFLWVSMELATWPCVRGRRGCDFQALCTVCDRHCVQYVKGTVYSMWQALCTVCDRHCVQYVTCTVYSMWQALCTICDRHCVQYVAGTVYSMWQALCTVCDRHCVQFVTGTVYSMWQALLGETWILWFCNLFYILA